MRPNVAALTATGFEETSSPNLRAGHRIPSSAGEVWGMAGKRVRSADTTEASGPESNRSLSRWSSCQFHPSAACSRGDEGVGLLLAILAFSLAIAWLARALAFAFRSPCKEAPPFPRTRPPCLWQTRPPLCISSKGVGPPLNALFLGRGHILRTAARSPSHLFRDRRDR